MAEYDSWEPLAEIVNYLPGVSLRQLTRWEERRETNGFPQPKETLGRYKFFDPEEIIKWWTLWTKATKNMRRGAKLNGAR